MQPDLSNIKQKLQGNRDIIDNLTTKIGNYIPAFKGFVETAESYAADQLVRDFMADKIQKIKQEISDLMSSMSREGRLEFLGEIDALGLGLEKLFKKSKHADYGPSASASKLKVTDADKERLLEYDWRLISNLDEFNDPIAKLKSAQGADAKAAVSAVRDKIKNFETLLDERKNVIMEVI